MAKADSLYKRHVKDFNNFASKIWILKKGERLNNPNDIQKSTGYIVSAILYAACIISEEISKKKK